MGQADPERFAGLVAAAPDLAWVCGVAEAWAVPFWAAGAIGFTSGIANVAPERSLEVLDALKADDVARAEVLVDRLRPIEQLRAGRGDANNVAVIKAAMDHGRAGRRRPAAAPLGAGAGGSRRARPDSAEPASSCDDRRGPSSSVACSTSACRSRATRSRSQVARRFYGEIARAARNVPARRVPRRRHLVRGRRPGAASVQRTVRRGREHPNRAAIRASRSTTSSGLRAQLVAAGVTTRDHDGEIPGRPRFFAVDPFGNTLEFVHFEANHW